MCFVSLSPRMVHAALFYRQVMEDKRKKLVIEQARKLLRVIVWWMREKTVGLRSIDINWKCTCLEASQENLQKSVLPWEDLEGKQVGGARESQRWVWEQREFARWNAKNNIRLSWDCKASQPLSAYVGFADPCPCGVLATLAKADAARRAEAERQAQERKEARFLMATSRQQSPGMEWIVSIPGHGRSGVRQKHGSAKKMNDGSGSGSGRFWYFLGSSGGVWKFRVPRGCAICESSMLLHMFHGVHFTWHIARHH